MTTIVIDLTTNQWLALLGAALIGAVLACLVTWPFVFLNGYEKRSEEEAEEVEGILERKRTNAR